MQEMFPDDPAARAAFMALLSRERFARYIADARGDEARAVALYAWNMRVSQSLHVYLHGWEIALRNRLNEFLTWRYGRDWPYEETRFRRNLAREDERRLVEAIAKQERDRGMRRVPTHVVVADLSAGFWVSLMSRRYDVPYVWRGNLGRVFLNDRFLDRATAWDKCDGILRLRNRVAHHEPIYHLALQDLHSDLRRLVGGMCAATQVFSDASCNFQEVWRQWHVADRVGGGDAA